MLRSVSEGAPTESVRPPSLDRADRAMDVLQYGMAAIAIIVVTLLATVR